MPLLNEFIRLPLGDIQIARDSRQRKIIDTSDIDNSILRNGVIQPIIVERRQDASIWLVAGERRLESSRKLNLPDIPVRFAESLSPIELQIIELEENIKRKDLSWQDMVQATSRIHALFVEIDQDWMLAETAQAICLTSGAVSMYLSVAAKIADPKVANCDSVREAYNLLKRRDHRVAGDALQDLLEGLDEILEPAKKQQEEIPQLDLSPESKPKQTAGGVLQSEFKPIAVPSPSVGKTILPAEQSILHESFIHWAPKYEGKKFNLIHCDFPYGINLFAGRQGGGRDGDSYSDKKDVYIALLETLCGNLNRLASVSCHLMFWFSDRLSGPTGRQATLEIFRKLAPELIFYPFPLVWIKSDNVGIASDPRHGPRHVYETCLLASRGSRQIVKVVGDAYSSPTDRSLHTSTKPVPMLKHFMSMLVDETTSLLDPTCGSGAALRAAEELGARHVLGMDIDEQTVGVARQALRNVRMLGSRRV